MRFYVSSKCANCGVIREFSTPIPLPLNHDLGQCVWCGGVMRPHEVFTSPEFAADAGAAGPDMRGTALSFARHQSLWNCAMCHEGPFDQAWILIWRPDLDTYDPVCRSCSRAWTDLVIEALMNRAER